MASGILCSAPKAKIPFFISSVSLNVYSIEELCFFLGKNLLLADSELVNESLANWIGSECSNKALALEMKEILAEAADPVPECLSLIFRRSGYYSQSELNALFSSMKKYSDLQESKRLRLQADVLMERGKYQRAIDFYEEILKGEKKTGFDRQFTGTVYYNAACAYERLFYTEKAEEYFMKAYELLMDRPSMSALLCAAYMSGGIEALNEMARKVNAHRTLVEDVMEKIEDLPVPDYPDDLEAAVDEWIDAYHYATDL